MTRNHLLPFLLLLGACARTTEGQPSPAESSAPASEPTGAQEFAAFEISWPRPASTEIARRAKSVAETMLAQGLPEQPFAEQLANAASTSLDFSSKLGASSASMLGRYEHGPDELRLDNRELQRDASSEPDLGETAARARFLETVQRLGDAAVVDDTLYDLNAAIVSRTLFGLGSSDTDDLKERVISYDFLARQSLNGIPFVNAGVRISVHRSGAIAGVRVGGAQAAAVFEGGRLHPKAPGYIFRATVNQQYYQGRFSNEFPRARIASQGTMYMLPRSVDPEAGKKQVLEPKYVFAFSNHYADVVGRRRYVGYSLSNPTLPPEDLNAPATPNEVGDPRPVAPPQPSTSGGVVGE